MRRRLLAYLHCRTRIHVQTRIRIQNPIATLRIFTLDSDSHLYLDWDLQSLLYPFLPPANVVCEGYVFTPVCDSVNRGGACVVAPSGGGGRLGWDAWLLGGHAWLLWGVCMVAPGGGGCAWLLQGGHVWLLRGGHAWLLGGHVWLLGGVHGCSGGGVHGCSGGGCVVAPGGACMVAPGGCAWLWLLWGGVCGCSWGACMVARGGVCVVAPGRHVWDTTRYGDMVNERAVRILLECILVGTDICPCPAI